MSLNIISSKENILLKRKEILATIEFKGVTPSREEVYNSIASKLGVDKSLVAIKNIKTEFGMQKAKIIAYIYHDLESFKRIEEIRKKKSKTANSKEEEKKA